MTNSENKNNLELENQDFEILQAVYDEKLTLGEYAVRVAVPYEEAEKRLADALRRRKTNLTFRPNRYSPPDDGGIEGQHLGFRNVPRASAHIQPLKPDQFADLEDLDDWLSLD